MPPTKALPKPGPKKKRGPPQIKLKTRPSAAAFRAGAAQLDRINARVQPRTAPVFLCLSSDSESETEISGSEIRTARLRSPPTRCHNNPIASAPHGNIPATQVHKASPPRRRQRRRPIVPDLDDAQDISRSHLTVSAQKGSKRNKAINTPAPTNSAPEVIWISSDSEIEVSEGDIETGRRQSSSKRYHETVSDNRQPPRQQHQHPITLDSDSSGGETGIHSPRLTQSSRREREGRHSLARPSIILGEQDSRSLSIDRAGQDLVYFTEDALTGRNVTAPSHYTATERSIAGPGHQEYSIQGATRANMGGSIITPPPSIQKNRTHASEINRSWAEKGSIAPNAYHSQHPSGNGHILDTSTLPTCMQVKAPIQHASIQPNIRRGSGLEYRKEIDPTYDPMRDPDHRIHQSSNIPIPSIEPTGRQARAEIRGRRS